MPVPPGRSRGIHRVVAAVLGLLGAALIALASLAPEGVRLPAALAVVRPTGSTAVLLYATGGLLLCAGWLLARPRRGEDPRRQLGLAALWALPLTFSLPLLSKDVWLYLDQGWQLRAGLDPYAVGLTEAGGPYASLVSPFWAGTTAVYPPLALRVGQLGSMLGGSDPYWSAVAMRLPVLVGLAVVGLLVPTIARRVGVDPARATWAAVASPLVLLAGVGGVHHDMLAAVLGVVAVWAAVRCGERWSLGWAGAALLALACAALVKQPAAVLGLPLVLLASGRRQAAWPTLLMRLAGAGVLGGLLFLALSWLLAPAHHALGWLGALDVPRAGSTLAPGALLYQGWRALAGGPADYPALPATIVQLLGVALLAGTLLRLRPTTNAARAGLTLAWLAPLLLALTSPALWPWYLLPCAMLVAADPRVVGPAAGQGDSRSRGLSVVAWRGVSSRGESRLGKTWRGESWLVALTLGLTAVQVAKERSGYGMGLGLWGALALGALVTLITLALITVSRS